MTDETDGKPAGKPFQPGREKTGGRKAGVGNHIPSKRAVQKRLLAQIHNALSRHAAIIEQLYTQDPMAASQLDARVNRDCVEMLATVEKLGGVASNATDKPGHVDTATDLSPAAIAALVREQGPMTTHEAQRAYRSLIAAEPGSDQERILFAHFALSEKQQLDMVLEQIATAASVTVDQVRAVFDAAGKVLRPPAPAPAPQLALPAPAAAPRLPEPEPLEGVLEVARRPAAKPRAADTMPAPNWADVLGSQRDAGGLTVWQRGY